jgi:hypothetical protein
MESFFFKYVKYKVGYNNAHNIIIDAKVMILFTCNLSNGLLPLILTIGRLSAAEKYFL